LTSVKVEPRLRRHDFVKCTGVSLEHLTISQGGEIMKIQRVREIARERGLQPGKAEKEELIKAIQRQEGNFDCFATAYDGMCDQTGCRWREDCFAAARSAKNS
jgi:hypothetical protein